MRISVEWKQRFSLPELVVVVTVIVCLASVLVPLALRGLLSSQSTRCSANLNSLGDLVQVYLNDSKKGDGQLPAYEDGWLQTIGANANPDLEPDGILNCPSQKFVSYGEGIAPAQWWRGTNYGINQHIASNLQDRNSPLPHWTQAQISDIKIPQEKLLIADAVGGNYFGIKGRDPVVAGISKSGRNFVDGIPPNPVSPLPCMRHVDGAANFLFLDGHVEQRKEWPEFSLGRGTPGFAFWHAEHTYPGLPDGKPKTPKATTPGGAGPGTPVTP